MSYDIRFGVKVEGAKNAYAIIGRPEVELKDRRGNRMIVKIKYRDFV